MLYEVITRRAVTVTSPARHTVVLVSMGTRHGYDSQARERKKNVWRATMSYNFV